MTPSDILDRSIQSDVDSLRSCLPVDRTQAVLAVTRHLDRLPPFRPATSSLELALGTHLPDLGGQLAFEILLDTGDAADTANPAPSFDPDWARRFLARCRQVEMAMLLRREIEAGYMRLDLAGESRLDAWISRKQLSTRLRERADFEWLRTTAKPEPAYCLDYPPATVIGSTTVGVYEDVVNHLRKVAATTDVDHAIPESDLVSLLSRELDFPSEAIHHAIQPLTLSPANAAWHATLPGVALPPVIRLATGALVVSRRGLHDEPYLFLVRELRRRDAPGYHDAAHHREEVFRADLSQLFADRRFVHAERRIVLRRPEGNIRTDIDAAIFDRKTGTLALFELKSIDPFARSPAELQRQRDNVLYANRQVSGILDWINRFGADDIINRIDRRTAKTFRVQRVLPFVLCRYLARFDDGPAPDSRAVWVAWPEVLRAAEQREGRSKESNPLATLFQRLRSNVADPVLAADSHLVGIDLGETAIRVFPSVAARSTAG